MASGPKTRPHQRHEQSAAAADPAHPATRASFAARMAAVLAVAWFAGCGAGNDPEDARTASHGDPAAPSVPDPAPTVPVGAPAPTPPASPMPPTQPAPPPSNAPSPASALPNCAAPLAAFTQSILPEIKGKCSICHVPGGLAGGTRLVLLPTASELDNFRVLRDFSKTLGPVLLAKSVGLPSHTGGRPFGDTNSAQYKALAKLVSDMRQPGCTDAASGGEPPPQAGAPAAPATGVHPASGGFWQGVGFESTATVLARSSVLLAGRPPRADELAAAQAGGVPALRQLIRGYMQGPTFESLIDDMGEAQFLTPGVVVLGDEQGLDPADWPSAGAMLKAEKEGVARTAVQARFDAAVRHEPVELMKFIVRNERPYTEIVSANYTVVNGLLAGYLGAQVSGTFKNKEDDNEWLMATLPNARLGGVREHAGVLSSHAWLQRFPTTDTNRNRHRVNMLFRQFLATDVTALAARPLDDATVSKVPTVENPNCSVCHNVIDPMAAGFQNWSDTNRFRPHNNKGTNHALPPTYLTGRYPKDANNRPYYKGGDNWFRDGAAPGYGAKPMPGGFEGNPTALQWLGQQVTGDARFSLGAVHFFYRGLMGREPLEAPFDTNNPQYAGDLAAHAAQSAEFTELAARFQADQGHGRFNAKDLMTDLLLSRWATASRASGLDLARTAQLGDVGSTHMLAPAQLNRKLKTLLGLGWDGFDDPYKGFGVVYGEFDGADRLNAARAHTTMQSVVVDRMASLKSCTFVMNDFAKTPANRLLFPHVKSTDLPDTPGGLEAITRNIQHLHKALWRDDAAVTDVEVQRTVKLFKDTWNDRATAPPKPLDCAYNNSNDPAYAARAWAVIVAYMVGDPRFLFE